MFAPAGGFVVVAMAAVVAFGSLRYGSADGVWRRVYSEIVSRRPHPLLAPTPLPTAVFEAQVTALTTLVAPTTGAQPKPKTVQPSPTSARSLAAGLVSLPATVVPSSTAAITRADPPDPLKTGPEAPGPTAQPWTVPPNVQLTGLTHMWQTWNNCGPATLAMDLSFFGLKKSQADVAASLRPNREDKNVSPDEMAAFARAQGLNAVARSNGDPDLLRRLLANGIPVLVETWYVPKPNDGMGHYRLLTGYDDAKRVWIAYDSYDSRGIDRNRPYAGIRIPYDELSSLWTVFNRQYVVLFDQNRAANVDSILGEELDDNAMWQLALVGAQTAVEQKPADPFAWFNLGSDLTALGRYEDAAKAYDKARQIGLPWRMFWYQFGAFKAYYETGRYDEVVALANATIRTAKYVEELYYWRGLAQLAQMKTADARLSFKQALEMNRNYAPAAQALAAPPAP